MSLTYKDFAGELVESIPKLPFPLAQRFVNRAWRDIQNSRQWSFLQGEGVLFSPAVITTGAFQVTQFSNLITANAAAITALNGLSNPVLTKRQIRFGSGGTSIYNISVIDPSFASNGRLYLDRPYKESSNSAISYRCYRCYYGPPEVTTVDANGTATTAETTDFLRYDSIYIPTFSRYFILPVRSGDLLNYRDPQRATTGNIPYWIFSYKSSLTLAPQFELWPHPLAALSYICRYQKKGTDFSADTDVLPAVIDDAVLQSRSMYYACDWAAKKAALYPELKGINWLLQKESYKRQYSNPSLADLGLLEIAQRNDEEQFPQHTIISNRTRNNYPLGSDERMVYSNVDVNTGLGS